MHFDTDGVYTLLYTAEDECGNTTTEEREVLVANPRTVLYTDGTLIINEQPRDMARNIALHGAATNVYVAFDPNGSTSTERYEFSTQSSRPWNSVASSIKAVEIGSNISARRTAYWFYGFTTCTSIDLTNLDSSNVSLMERMFYDCRVLTTLDLSSFNTSSVTNMSSMFSACSALTPLDLSNFDTSSVTDMSEMFSACRALTTLDLSNFNTSSVTDMEKMFDTCNLLNTIYASANFVVTQVTNSSAMFYGATALVGGAGTVYNATYLDKTYAHIDGGTADPGYFTAKS